MNSTVFFLCKGNHFQEAFFWRAHVSSFMASIHFESANASCTLRGITTEDNIFTEATFDSDNVCAETWLPMRDLLHIGLSEHLGFFDVGIDM